MSSICGHEKARKAIWLILIICLFGLSSFWVTTELLINYYSGDYYSGFQGTSCNLSIMKNREFTVTYAAYSPNGIVEAKPLHGTYSLKFGLIVLKLTDANFGDTNTSCIAPIMVAVEWQNRKYLFFHDYDSGRERSEWLRTKFCKGVNSGEELDYEGSGTYLPYINVMDKDMVLAGYDSRASASPRMLGVIPFCPK